MLAGINNLAVSDHNKLSIGNSDIPKVLMEILQREGPLVFPPTDEDEGEKGGEKGGEGAGGTGGGGGGGVGEKAEAAGSDTEEDDLESKEVKALAAKVSISCFVLLLSYPSASLILSLFSLLTLFK